MGCQMLFAPTEEAMDSGTAKIGVILFGGALVDPRSYSVLAQDLAHNYGIAVSIPIFENDVAFLGCGGTDRIPLAEWAFPHVEKWVLVGHSMGGIGLQTNVLVVSNRHDETRQPYRWDGPTRILCKPYLWARLFGHEFTNRGRSDGIGRRH